MVTKEVTQWIFNPTSRKSYCLAFTEIYYHPIFYRPHPQGVQILLQIFYDLFMCNFPTSVKSLILESLFLQISFTYTRNSNGPKTLTCVTSEVTLTYLDSFPPTLTLSVRPTRNSPTQMTTLESTPEAASFISPYQCFSNWVPQRGVRSSERRKCEMEKDFYCRS